jgi:hypothetical protein
VFIDPTAGQPYLFHLAEVSLLRKSYPPIQAFALEETVETRLVALREEAGGNMELCPVESLLLLRGGKGIPPLSLSLAVTAKARLPGAEQFALEQAAQPMVARRKQALLVELPERESFIKRGYAYQEAELAAARARCTEKANQGDPHARGELTRIKTQQRELGVQREAALAVLRREPDLMDIGPVDFKAHALVVPSSDPEEVKRRDERIEAIAMQVAIAYEEANGAVVKDVHTPELARSAGLNNNPGFDIISRRPDGSERAIEVKGRDQTGDIDISENEWGAACNLLDKYWLYIVYNCSSAHPDLGRINNPWAKLIAKARGFTIKEQEIDQFFEVEK